MAAQALIEQLADVESIQSRVAAVCSSLARDHAELIALTGELIERELWAEGGVRSPEHWLQVRAGLSPGRAREIVRLARRADEIPSTIALMREGRVGVDQAAVVAAHVPAGFDISAAQLVPYATVGQLRRSLSRYQFLPPTPSVPPWPGDPEPPAGPDPFVEAPTLSMGSIDGRFSLRFTAPADLGALVEQAIREATDALHQAGTIHASHADGMIEVATRALAAAPSTSRTDRFRIHVFLDTADFGARAASQASATPSVDGQGASAHGPVTWIGERGMALPDHIRDRTTCTGHLTPIWVTQGTPVAYGRTQRIVPQRLRTLLITRDGGCRYPGCPSTHHLDVHHLVHWIDGGATDPHNLVTLCGWHHDRHHDGQFSITGDPTRADGLRFRSRGGGLLAPLVASVPAGARDSVPRAEHHADPIRPAECRPDQIPPEEHHPAPMPRAEWRADRATATTWTGPSGEVLHARWLTLAPDPSSEEVRKPSSATDPPHWKGSGTQRQSKPGPSP